MITVFPLNEVSYSQFLIHLKTGFLIVLFIAVGITSSNGQGFKENFTDSTDNAFDISTWLSQVYGFIPIANVITEPAVGYGGAFGLVYLGKRSVPNYKGDPMPPDISVIAGALTENGTWAGILVHQAYLKQDRIRFRAIAGYLSPNLAIYRDGPLGNTRKFEFNLQGPLFLPSVSFRLKSSRSFLGLDYIFMKNEVEFDKPLEDIPVSPGDLETTLSGIGIHYTYDSRDNTFTPNKGVYAHASYTVFNDYIGSNVEYSRLDSYVISFLQLGKVILGGRLDYRAAFNSPPFYALPFVTLRGVPAFRYQGKQLFVLETEERWDVTKRWSLVGFAGLGRGFEKIDTFDEEDWAYGVGGGFRYLMARKFNIYSGVDVARGPEEWAFYIQFGHYWNRL